MDKKLVIIPTYNEKENIADIIQAVFSLPGDFHVLVIDDGSPDGTADIVRSVIPGPDRESNLHLIERSGKLGLGTAYLTGFKWALEHGYDYVFEMDADFSHDPKDLLRLYQACSEGGADLAVGSRYCNGVSVVDWPMSRIVMSYFASTYVRGVLQMKVYDTTAGFVCYSRKVLEKMNQTEGSPHNLHKPPEGHVQNERRHLRRGFLGRHRPPLQAFLRSFSPILLRSRSTERTWTFICWWSFRTFEGTAIPRSPILEACMRPFS